MKITGNIVSVKERGLCISCGICAANCPKGCISLVRDGFEVVPVIEDSRCVQCGICAKVCPARQLDACDRRDDLIGYMLGDHREILCVQAKDREILSRATSGGFISQIIPALLDGGDYQSAFLLDGYEFTDTVETSRFTAESNFLETGRSRYLPVSHESAARYMIEHPEERIIFVGTGCAMQGLLNTMELHRLKREQYLLIGLFCDKTMNYGVISYFAEHPRGKGRKMRRFYFRTKSSGGWPGEVRIDYADGSHEDLSRRERMKVKEYFVPERCLYCLDKLNRNCDIAVGDNYIKRNHDELGVNSCVIRTEAGLKIWNQYRDLFHFHADDAQDLIQSQHLDSRGMNYQYACLKGIYDDPGAITQKARDSYRTLLKKMAIGRKERAYANVHRDLRYRAASRKIKRAIKRLTGRS